MYKVIKSATSWRYKFDPYRFESDLIESLYDLLPSYNTEIKSYPGYGEIQIFSKYMKQKIRALVVDILKNDGIEVYVPLKSKPYDFVAIKNEVFISLRIEDNYKSNNANEVVITIQYNNSNIFFESWYSRYESSQNKES